MSLITLGINHKTAPVELRECIAISNDESATALQYLSRETCFSEVLLYSTCNRVEVVFVAENKSQAIDAATNFIADFNKIPREQFEAALYVHEGDEAVRHVFRVAASLDSMVVGEPQILGQMKDAYRDATNAKTSGVILNRLLHRSFFVAKRIRTETGIGDRAVSISYAAVELARKIFGNIEGKNILLIGAGEMAELAVEHLIRNRAGNLVVANRTFENGVALAKKFNGNAIRFEEIESVLKDIDIIISSTGSPSVVITKDQVKKGIRVRRNRPIFFIDIAVPRDIDPTINRLSNSYVYDIDDLKGIIDDNLEDRNKEAIKGERIVDEAVIRFREWHLSLDVVPTIVALRNKIGGIVQSEMKKSLQPNAISQNSMETIDRISNSLVNKILHDPTIFLKRDGMRSDKSLYIDAVRKLFKLNE